jgi:hypothetical protein
MRRVQSRLLDFLRSMGGRRRRDGGLPYLLFFFFCLPQFLGYIYLARLFDSHCGVEVRIE